mmetsp:Transcript_11421/g.29466  ORF Transcript_11421/g.29466 Transcript_11421/m.29466 type:complete len:228 (-) Transcript_11421:93-776(-)
MCRSAGARSAGRRLVPLVFLLAGPGALAAAALPPLSPAGRPGSSPQPSALRSAPGRPLGAWPARSAELPEPRRRACLAALCVCAALLLGAPRRAEAKARAVVALDEGFVQVTAASWAQTSGGLPGLVQGLRGEPFFLLPGKDGGALRNYALKAECTHLGCIAPWDQSTKRFVCPCHGSQYDEEGRVLRGPAPTALALAHVSLIAGDKVQLSAWTETDFRDDSAPWWK